MKTKDVVINTTGIAKLQAMLKRAITGINTGDPFDKLFKKWGALYLADMRKRFIRLSKGGGEWAELSLATIARRRKGKKVGRPLIMRDTGTLLNALSIGATGNLFVRISGGIKVGFNDDPHPNSKGDSIRDIAVRLHNGDRKTNLPARPIIVKPSPETEANMMMEAKKTMEEVYLLCAVR